MGRQTTGSSQDPESPASHLHTHPHPFLSVSGFSHYTSPNAASATDCSCLHVSVTEVVKSSNLAGRSFTVSLYGLERGDRQLAREPKGKVLREGELMVALHTCCGTFQSMWAMQRLCGVRQAQSPCLPSICSPFTHTCHLSHCPSTRLLHSSSHILIASLTTPCPLALPWLTFSAQGMRLTPFLPLQWPLPQLHLRLNLTSEPRDPT